MNLNGMWKICEVAQLDGDKKFVWKSPEEIVASGETNPETLKMNICFKDDGNVQTLISLPKNLPQSEIDAAMAGGMVICDGHAVLETRQWKEENGDFFYYDGSMGTIMGEEASPWTKIIIDGEKIDFGMLRLEKIG